MYRIRGIPGLEEGPHPISSLRAWIAEGVVTNTAEVLREGETEWRRVGDVSELSVPSIPPVPSGLGRTPPPLPLFQHPGTTPLASPKRSRPRNSGYAIASFVLGLLGFFGVTGILSLILGGVGISQINKSDGRLRGRLYAIVGMVLSTLFLSLLLMVVIMAVSNQPGRRMMHSAMPQDCRGNLTQLGQTFRAYSNDHADLLPSSDRWSDGLRDYASSLSIFLCSPSRPGQRSSFAMNSKLSGHNIEQVNANSVLLFESGADWNGAGGSELARGRDGQGVWVLLVNGTTRYVPVKELPGLRWEP